MIGRAAWHRATVAALAAETPSARRITLDVPTWPGNAAGQHLDIRLTAPDGYQASRSYSIASTGDGTRVELAVDRVAGGEVSGFLVDVLETGDQLEVRGPLGGWFVWDPPAAGDTDPRPLQLIAGGSGIVPLMAMVRAHVDAGDATRFRLVYAVRTPDDVFFADELTAAAAGPAPVSIDYVYSRRGPAGWTGPVGRIDQQRLYSLVATPAENPRLYVCGSTPFVEQILDWLIELGYPSGDIRAERFGGST